MPAMMISKCSALVDHRETQLARTQIKLLADLIHELLELDPIDERLQEKTSKVRAVFKKVLFQTLLYI